MWNGYPKTEGTYTSRLAVENLQRRIGLEGNSGDLLWSGVLENTQCVLCSEVVAAEESVLV